MKLSGSEGTLLLERSELGAPGTPADGDVLVNVTVDARGFAAADQSWVVRSDWEAFLVELRALESRRQGVAALVGPYAEEFRIEFFSIDHAGHMALRGQVRRPTMEGFELELRFGFTFAPDELPRVLRELEDFTQR